MMKTLLLFCACASLWAQGTVTIFGAVADSSGSVMPNVTVRAIRSGTGAIRQAISDTRSDYVITQLPAGKYSVTAEAAGFKKFVLLDVTIQVDENRQVPIVLEVGATTDSVTVKAEAAQ